MVSNTDGGLPPRAPVGAAGADAGHVEAMARKAHALSANPSQWFCLDDTFSLDIGHRTPLGSLRRWARHRRLLRELLVASEAGEATHEAGKAAIGQALRPRKRPRDVDMADAAADDAEKGRGAGKDARAEGKDAGEEGKDADKSADKDADKDAVKEPIVRDELWRPRIGRLLDGPPLFSNLHPDRGHSFADIKARLEKRLEDLVRDQEVTCEHLAAAKKTPSENAPLLSSVHEVLAAKRQKK